MIEEKMSEHEQNDWLFPDGFTGFRSGLKEHIRGRRFNAIDLAVYHWLHYFASWKAGICVTSAKVIAEDLRTPRRTIQAGLGRLKAKGFVNYPAGTGTNTYYAILINKARPTIGALLGYELDAFASKDFNTVTYINKRGASIVAAWKRRGESGEEALCLRGESVLAARIQDIQNGKDRKTGQDSKTSNGCYRGSEGAGQHGGFVPEPDCTCNADDPACNDPHCHGRRKLEKNPGGFEIEEG